MCLDIWLRADEDRQPSSVRIMVIMIDRLPHSERDLRFWRIAFVIMTASSFIHSHANWESRVSAMASSPIQMTGIMSRVGGSYNFPAARYSYNGHNETCSAPVKVRIQVGQLLLGELTRPGLPTHWTISILHNRQLKSKVFFETT